MRRNRWWFVVLVVLVGVSIAAPVYAAPLANGGLTLDGVIDSVRGALRWLALLGILLYVATLIGPVKGLLGRIGVEIPSDYLLVFILAAVILGYSETLVSLFGG